MKVLGGMVPKAMASNMPFLGGVGLNAHTGVFAAAIAVLASLLLAATPILRLSFQKVREGLADGDRARRAGCGRGWDRTWWWWNWRLRWCCWRRGTTGTQLLSLVTRAAGLRSEPHRDAAGDGS